MFIQTEATPNPATLKFIPGKPVVTGNPLDFRSADEATNSPLAQRLFSIAGVSGVFLGGDFITVSKVSGEWQHLKPAILGVIMEHYMSGAPVVVDRARRTSRMRKNSMPKTRRSSGPSRNCSTAA